MCHFCIQGRRDFHLEELAPIPPIARQPGGNVQPDQMQMTGPEIQLYMRQVAEYLNKKRKPITVVGVGGVLNAVALGTRASTHDVDILCDSMTSDQTRHLRDAIRKVAKKHKLSEHWLNNQTILHIPLSLRALIQQEAMEQNCVVFEAPGLKIVAAPWKYAFASKLHRISGSGAGQAREYDPSDAANFLMKYLELQRRHNVTVSEIKGWLAQYRIHVEDGPLSRAFGAVNNAAGQPLIVQ